MYNIHILLCRPCTAISVVSARLQLEKEVESLKSSSSSGQDGEMTSLKREVHAYSVGNTHFYYGCVLCLVASLSYGECYCVHIQYTYTLCIMHVH